MCAWVPGAGHSWHARVCRGVPRAVHGQADAAGDSWMRCSRVLVHPWPSGSGSPSLSACRACVSYAVSPKPSQRAGSFWHRVPPWRARGFPGADGGACLARRGCSPASGSCRRARDGSSGRETSWWETPVWGGVGFARLALRPPDVQAAGRDVREEYGRAVPGVVTSADVLCFFWQQPVPESAWRLRAGTMEASGRTPASPTRRVQTIIQVSTRVHRTSALREHGDPAGSPSPPQPALPRAAGTARRPLLAPILLRDRQQNQLS